MSVSVYSKLKEEYEKFLRNHGWHPNEVKWPFRYGLEFPQVREVEAVFVAKSPPKTGERYFYNPNEHNYLRPKLLAVLSIHDEELKSSLKEEPKKSLEVFLKRYYLTDVYKIPNVDMGSHLDFLAKEITVLSPRLVISLGEFPFAWMWMRKWIKPEKVGFGDNVGKLLHLKIGGRVFELIPTYFPR